MAHALILGNARGGRRRTRPSISRNRNCKMNGVGDARGFTNPHRMVAIPPLHSINVSKVIYKTKSRPHSAEIADSASAAAVNTFSQLIAVLAALEKIPGKKSTACNHGTANPENNSLQGAKGDMIGYESDQHDASGLESRALHACNKTFRCRLHTPRPQ